jgi:hypothetical protein
MVEKADRIFMLCFAPFANSPSPQALTLSPSAATGSPMPRRAGKAAGTPRRRCTHRPRTREGRSPARQVLRPVTPLRLAIIGSTIAGSLAQLTTSHLGVRSDLLP